MCKHNKLFKKIFSTGNTKFIIENVIPITQHSANLHIRLLDAGYFSNITIQFGSDELTDGILSGQILEVG